MKGASLSPTASTPSAKPIAGIFDKTGLPEQDVTDGNDGSTMVAPAMAIPEVESPVQMLQAIYMQDPTNQDVRFALEKLQQQGRI